MRLPQSLRLLPVHAQGLGDSRRDERDRRASALRPTGRRRAPYAAWFAYVAIALTCTEYVNSRAKLVPKWGVWYAADPHPYILLQLRAWLSGHLAVLAHPAGAANDYQWGRA